MQQRRKIIWKYWWNPFGNNDDEFMDEDEANQKTPWEEKEDDIYNTEPQRINIRPVVPTPLGFMPIQPFQSFTKAFQFWMGHTNFDITQEVKEKIESVAGVEILDIITRYCFRVAIGKAFDGTEVKLEIMRVLNATPPKKGEINPYDIKLDENTQQKVAVLQETIKDKYQFWAILVLPNGEIDVSVADSADKYSGFFELYQQIQKMTGGIIYQYA